MKKSVMCMAAVLTVGILSWRAPVVSYGETENSPVMVSQVLEIASEEIDEDAENGPDLAIQQAKAEAQAAAQAEAEAQAAAQAAVDARQNLIQYALQFVGGPYRAGGNDPRTGVDCSGFVRYVMQNGAGIAMNRSSSSQSTQGRAISSGEMQPGDLIFYGSGSGINHVAMYIGNGQVVHASTYSTGIKVSPWNYRSPVKIVTMF